jgi:hypothetical protein
MKYYRVTYSIEKKKIGHYPQVQNTTWEGKPYDHGAFGTQGLFSAVHNNPAIPTLEFYKSTKITSLIHMVEISENMYIIVNEQFLEFLKLYYLGGFQTWKIKAKRKDENYDYYIFFADYPKADFINYEKSIFKLFKHNEKYNVIDLNHKIDVISDEDCMDKYRQYPPIGIEKPFLEAEKIVVNGSKMDVDFFRSTSPTMAGYYVSEKLKAEIEKQGFTGMQFQELDKINNFVEVEII